MFLSMEHFFRDKKERKAFEQWLKNNRQFTRKGDRNLRVFYMYLKGKSTFKQVGDRYGVTSTRARQVYWWLVERAHAYFSGDREINSADD